MPLNSLIHPLFPGPLDIVGDVHGEIDALRDLLHHLGCSQDGDHPERRRLVFLGDLTDRGPDSPAVVTLVENLVNAGKAQCILGNHDLNILLELRKYDNGWYFGETFYEDGQFVPQILADGADRTRIAGFFRTLPLALERDDLRVVHACWNGEMVDIARQATDVEVLYEEHRQRIDTELDDTTDTIDRGLAHQNGNPVKVLTSGLERHTKRPFMASGKMRSEERVPWWENYSDEPTCVFGHYPQVNGLQNGSQRAICVDFGVGKRYTERGKGTGQFQYRLAALRFPERQLVFDDGSIEDWNKPRPSESGKATAIRAFLEQLPPELKGHRVILQVKPSDVQSPFTGESPAFDLKHLREQEPGAPVTVILDEVDSLTKHTEAGESVHASRDYVASKSSEVFHRAGCDSAAKISVKNLVHYASRDEALQAGKRPCNKCNS